MKEIIILAIVFVVVGTANYLLGRWVEKHIHGVKGLEDLNDDH